MKKLLISCFLLWHISPTLATSLLPVSLEQLSQKANDILYVQAVENKTEQDPISKQIVTYTSFEVIDTVKGDITGSHQIKQLGGELKSSHTRLTVHGVPRFIIGEKYVLFLPEKSTLGFSSPLGLHQGSFSVIEVDGQQLVTNGRNLTAPIQQRSSNIQAPLAVIARRPSQARLQDFINTVRVFNAQ